MAFERPGESPLNYHQCRYSNSRLLFRGPRQPLDAPYFAFVGGSETYGKYVAQPFPALLQDTLGHPCVNLSVVNAGIDAFMHEATVQEICSGAEVTVLQVMGTQNMSNRFYTVHPRRNDRFLKASTLLRTIYREVDFTEFSFTRHMLATLCSISPDRFETVKDELRSAWLARMRMFLSRVEGKVVLLWVTSQAAPRSLGSTVLGPEPLFVDRDLVFELEDEVARIVHVDIPEETQEAGRSKMLFPALEAGAAQEMISPGAHELIAADLGKALQP